MLRIQETVINGGYCVGCGACTAVENAPIKIELNDDGCFEAQIYSDDYSDEVDEITGSVCPFFNSELNESTIAADLFAVTNHHDSKIGYYHSIYGARVTEGDFFEKGSSGGVAKWLLYRLLHKGLVDYVVHVVGSKDTSQHLFHYEIVRSAEAVGDGAKSGYYPVEMSGVLKFIKENPGKYAVTGVPCFVKSIRLLQRSNPIFEDRVKYCLGIVCGHLKSRFYADMIGWQLGIQPGEVSSIDFRVKIRGEKANQKAVSLQNVSGDTYGPKRVNDLYGVNYGYGFFSYKACEFCDDVIAETADISFGDAWLPRFLDKGTSIVVSRNQELTSILEEAANSGALEGYAVTPAEVYQSQEGGFRHRREGLAIRIKDKRKLGEWVPEKRFESYHGGFIRRMIYRKRSRMTEKSFEIYKKALEAGGFEKFKKRTKIHIRGYKFLYALEGLKKRITGEK